MAPAGLFGVNFRHEPAESWRHQGLLWTLASPKG